MTVALALRNKILGAINTISYFLRFECGRIWEFNNLRRAHGRYDRICVNLARRPMVFAFTLRLGVLSNGLKNNLPLRFDQGSILGQPGPAIMTGK
jgi:hypothetical protein